MPQSVHWWFQRCSDQLCAGLRSFSSDGKSPCSLPQEVTPAGPQQCLAIVAAASSLRLLPTSFPLPNAHCATNQSDGTWPFRWLQHHGKVLLSLAPLDSRALGLGPHMPHPWPFLLLSWGMEVFPIKHVPFGINTMWIRITRSQKQNKAKSKNQTFMEINAA